MMLNILKTKKPYEQEAKALYAQCLSTVRRPWFYTDCGLPDTMEARFVLLLLHVFLLIDRNLSDAKTADSEALNQALFDIMFKDMDQTLREMGIGDMGVPKRMRKMMTGFNGRMHAYHDAIDTLDNANDSAPLRAVIKRNIYADNADESFVSILTDYALEQREHLKGILYRDLLTTTPLFTERSS
ncbi:MAG TPA: ubiquinol-cytochrome C reductase [Rhodospirillaceae bacterium]|nr:ubiquinol-cytochrome C reductase [Rhodospirillaceae bacterium]